MSMGKKSKFPNPPWKEANNRFFSPSTRGKGSLGKVLRRRARRKGYLRGKVGYESL